MDTLLLGTLTISAAGLLNGTFVFPMKLVKGWNWENIWLLFAVFGLILLPAAVAFTTVDGLIQIYRSVPASSVFTALLLGFGWGVGSLLFGLGVAALGFSLGYVVVMGTTAVIGTIIPALLVNPAAFDSERGLRLLGSLLLIVLGLFLCSIAGRRREQNEERHTESYRVLTQTTFYRGIAICLGSGVLSACFNIGFALTKGIQEAAQTVGATPGNASFSVWVLIMAAGSVPSVIYCVIILSKKKSYRLFSTDGRNWLYGAAMALLWFLTLRLYGLGAHYVGDQGATIGWPVMTASAIIGANALGLIGGEWRAVPKAVRSYLYTGLGILILAVALAGSAGSA
jgi:L-rhamnose-H+ transport protein